VDLFLGIDGGGTRTRAVLVSRDGELRGEGESGPSNYHNVGLERAGRNLVQAAQQAWAAAGAVMRPAEHAFLGCAGVRSSADSARILSVAESASLAPAGAVTVVNDLHNALAAGLAGEPGIALIAGTGSNCLGRDVTGTTFMCGGWGWLLDDEGSAMGLALAGLRAAVRAADKRARPTPILGAALAFFGLAEADELLARLYAQSWTADEIAAFAPVVIRHADAGDPTALDLLHSGARALGALVAGAAKQLSFPDGLQVVLLGGCVRSGPPYEPMVAEAVLAACPGAKLVDPVYPPQVGAAINVLRAAGIEPLPSIRVSIL
jgi:glucosamine kinase